MDEQNAQTTKQVEEAVACLSLDKSSESMSSYSRTSSSMTDIDDKDSGNEKDISISQGRIERDLNLHGELVTIDESLVHVERRKSASQGSMRIFYVDLSFHLFYIFLVPHLPPSSALSLLSLFLLLFSRISSLFISHYFFLVFIFSLQLFPLHSFPLHLCSTFLNSFFLFFLFFFVIFLLITKRRDFILFA